MTPMSMVNIAQFLLSLNGLQSMAPGPGPRHLFLAGAHFSIRIEVLLDCLRTKFIGIISLISTFVNLGV